jgi:hypothetical protein
MVHIIVGKEQQDFCIHKDLICHYSQYFTNGFTGGLEEGMTNIMKLPEVNVEVFKRTCSGDKYPERLPLRSKHLIDFTYAVFQGWLYTQVVFNNLADQADWPKTNDLMKLYVFADMARIPNLKNECIEAINVISGIDEAFPVETIPYVYKNTQKGSLIRRFIVDSLAWEYDPDTFAQIADHLTDEVRLEAMTTMRKVIYSYTRPGTGKPKKMASPLHNLKNYYEHEAKIKAKILDKATTKAAVKASVKASVQPSNVSPIDLCSSPVEPAVLPTEPPSAPVKTPISQPIDVPELLLTESSSSPMEAPKPPLITTLAHVPTPSPNEFPASPHFELNTPLINANTGDGIVAVKEDIMDIVKEEIKTEAKIEMKE